MTDCPPTLALSGNKCAQCSKFSNYCCIACRTHYCSVECQWTHWPFHRDSCTYLSDNQRNGCNNIPLAEPLQDQDVHVVSSKLSSATCNNVDETDMGGPNKKATPSYGQVDQACDIPAPAIKEQLPPPVPALQTAYETVDPDNNNKFKYSEIQQCHNFKSGTTATVTSHSFPIIYVMLTDNAEHLQEMSTELAEYCYEASPCTDVEEGDIVSALFDDETTYYRASVSHKINNDKIEVFYVDYGNKSVVSIDTLKVLDKAAFIKYPQFAVPLMIRLDDLSVSSLSNEAKTFLENLMDQRVTISVDKLGNVDILTTVAYKGKNSVVQILQSCCSFPAEKEDVSKLAITFPKDYKCPKIDNIELEFLGDVGSNVTVRVLSVVSPGIFVVEPINFNKERMLAQLEETTTEFGNKISASSEYIPEILDILLVLTEDGKWCRGYVVDAQVDAHTVDMFLVDRGKFEYMVPLNKTRFMPEKFMTMPARAVTCELEGCEKMQMDSPEVLLLQDVYNQKKSITICIILKLEEESAVVRLVP